MKFKEIVKYTPYLLPGYGVYQQFKKPKEERNTFGVIGFGIYSIPLLIKIGIVGLYLGKGIITKNWEFNLKSKTGQVIENKKTNRKNLENKTMQLNKFDKKLFQ